MSKTNIFKFSRPLVGLGRAHCIGNGLDLKLTCSECWLKGQLSWFQLYIFSTPVNGLIGFSFRCSCDSYSNFSLLQIHWLARTDNTISAWHMTVSLLDRTNMLLIREKKNQQKKRSNGLNAYLEWNSFLFVLFAFNLKHTGYALYLLWTKRND